MDSHFNWKDNVLLMTLDSCRWDTFKEAQAPAMKSRCSFVPGYSQGTYTYPSHMSIYAGILPDSRHDLPLYNRFKKNVFRIANAAGHVKSYVEFPAGTSSIISGFRDAGYFTFGLGALEWFRHPNLSDPFENFLYTGIDVESQVDYAVDLIENYGKPFFGFLNIGETHEPYSFGGLIEPTRNSRNRMRASGSFGFLHSEYRKQIDAIEFVDRYMRRLFESIEKCKNNTFVVVCGDHGECFGEDGCYGHGFYHPKVMEVPLGIFQIKSLR